jgi:DNA-binding XRE family transcriptional regulator
MVYDFERQNYVGQEELMEMKTIDLQDYALQRRPEIGQRIREVRSQAGWTQERTAHYLGCSRRRVNRVEQGITEFGVLELELLAQAWGVSVSHFLDE